MKRLPALLLLLCVVTIVTAQPATLPDKPKLVVGLVVDQMRWDYLYRYSEKYGTGGFNRLLKEGYNCQNTQIDYFPTYTACGHSCVYTGSVPAISGIAGNSWYNRGLGRIMMSVEDTTVTRVGEGKLSGKVSPANLLVTTIGDEMHFANNFRSKVISVALKDRSAILPGGHTGNGVYFFDGGSGNFITTSYYTQQLPEWVNAFNSQKKAQKYIADNWATILPIAQYHESTADNVRYEKPFKNEKEPVFTHKVSELATTGPDIIAVTPFGNTLTLDFAKAAIENEKLGKGTYTDLLAVSLSSPDIIGHQFGPNSIEVQDCYLRLDKDLAQFFAYLDEKVGKNNYVFFITADHGAAHAAGFCEDHHTPAGSFDMDTTVIELNKALAAKFGEGEWVLSSDNMQLYINHALMEEKDVSREDLFEACYAQLMKKNAVANVIDLQELAETTLPEALKMRYTNGYHVKRSGDFQVIYNPAWFEGFEQGTTHGSPYPYDTHIPLIWMGWKIKPGETTAPTYMTDIAPTLAAMLRIQEPNGNVGRVIQNLWGK